MPEIFQTFPTAETIREFLNAPITWIQVGIFLAGLVIIKLFHAWIEPRLQTITKPGVIEGFGRIVIRTASLALVPLLLWLWLLSAVVILRHHDQSVSLLHPAMILAGALAAIRMGVFILRHSLHPGGPLKAWEGVLTITIWLLVALHILGWLPWVEKMLDEYALTFGMVRISLLNVISFTFSIAFMLLLALWISSAIRSRVNQSRVLDDSMKVAVTKLFKFVLLTLAVLAAMVTAGIDITAFAIFGGALGVGLGLGLQRVVSNFVSGFILVFEGSIRPGDIISLQDTYGTVQSLHTRHVVIRTRDGLDILVPNENLLTSDITNWSYRGDRKIRVRLPVQISYADDPEVAMKRLGDLARGYPHILKDPPPLTFLTEFGDNGINLELRVWIHDPDNRGTVRTDLNLLIWKDFRAAGISIPFPQRDVYIKEFSGSSTSSDALSDSDTKSSPSKRDR